MPPGHAHIHVRGVPVRVGGQGGAGAGRPAPSEEERISRAAQEQQGEVKHGDTKVIHIMSVYEALFTDSSGTERGRGGASQSRVEKETYHHTTSRG